MSSRVEMVGEAHLGCRLVLAEPLLKDGFMSWHITKSKTVVGFDSRAYQSLREQLVLYFNV